MALRNQFANTNLKPSAMFPGRAAEYVRMSTDDQQYSIANQHDAILLYAAANELEVIRTYSDAGRSGLTIEGRIGLKRLINDIQNGAIDYSTVLVYDVSRWGRFQDVDEAAYYEHICKRAGVSVQYCAELFQGGRGITADIIKNIKRAMAAEYSRELSVKVFSGKCRLARMGYHLGGPPRYGLRRQLIGMDGRSKGILKPGEKKALHTDRVRLVLGPEEETKVVRWIYRRFVRDGATVERVVEDLNGRGIQRPDGRPWGRNFVTGILTSENYVGVAVFNTTSLKLGQTMIRNPPEEWIRVEGAHPAIVSRSLFDAAARRLKEGRMHRYTVEELVANLRRLLKKHGKLNVSIIDGEPDSPKSGAYHYRFGSLMRAFSLVGYVPDGRSMKNALIWQARRMRDEEELARLAGPEEAGLLHEQPLSPLPSVSVVSKPVSVRRAKPKASRSTKGRRRRA